MTPWIFSLIVTLSLVAGPVVLAEDTNTGSTTTEAQNQAALKEQARKNIEKLREQQKTHRDARKKALETAKTAREEKKLETAKDLAEKLISERAELLKKLGTGEHLKKCRAAAKIDATTAVNAAIARLGTIDVSTATTVEQVRALIKDTIIAKNRVYVGLLPAIRGMCAADRIIGIIDAKLMPLVTRLEENGKDVTKLKTEINAAKTDAESAYAAYKKIANNPGTATYKTDLAAAKALLTSAKKHLAAAREEIESLKTTSDDQSETPDTTTSNSPN